MYNLLILFRNVGHPEYGKTLIPFADFFVGKCNHRTITMADFFLTQQINIILPLIFEAHKVGCVEERYCLFVNVYDHACAEKKEEFRRFMFL